MTRQLRSELNTTPPTPANRLGIDYTADAASFDPPPAPIIDVHSHINGINATAIFRRAMDLYGIDLVYSMTKLDEAEAIRDALDGRIRYIAVPNYWSSDDRAYQMGRGFLEQIKAYHALGSRMVKFWVAPRATDLAIELGDPGGMRLDAPARIEAMELASELGMCFMTHVADPDTWFATKYADHKKYGSKLDQYEPLEKLLDRFTQPWIAAHMGGWPEDLAFLSGLLERHDNLYLDTSAAKWMIRELSKHTANDLRQFLDRFRGRILFGSDIVTADEHLGDDGSDNEMLNKASGHDEAFDLYAGRYWALRTLWETDYDGASPIADPDLEMIDPERYGPMDAPNLSGKSMPDQTLRSLYHDAAHDLLEPLFAGT